jgi:hypothetical protein
VYKNFIVTPKGTIISTRRNCTASGTQKYMDSDEESDPGWEERKANRRCCNTPSPCNSAHGSVWDLVVDDEDDLTEDES